MKKICLGTVPFSNSFWQLKAIEVFEVPIGGIQLFGYLKQSFSQRQRF